MSAPTGEEAAAAGSDGSTRRAFARARFADGERLAAEQCFAQAHAAVTAGHDVVLDDPALHREAHVRLRPLNAALGWWGEWATDVVLLILAPIGVFELVAWRASRGGDRN